MVSNMEGSKMNKLLVGLLLAFTASVSQAALTIVNPSVVNFFGYDGQPSSITGTYTTGQFGALSATTAGTFSATYLGNESGNFNAFGLSLGGFILENENLGKTISSDVSAGIIPFGFIDFTNPGFFINGSKQTKVLGFAILEGKVTEYGNFDYILGFNDNFKSDADYDDIVIGVKFVAAAVPEPETYAMLLAGLGIVGFTARRRKNLNA